MSTVLDRPVHEAQDTSADERTGDAWRVIVMNDDHNTFEGVAFALAATLPQTTLDRGLELATRIHYTGSAVVWSGHKELAELYWDQLRDFGLTLAPLER